MASGLVILASWFIFIVEMCSKIAKIRSDGAESHASSDQRALGVPPSQPVSQSWTGLPMQQLLLLCPTNDGAVTPALCPMIVCVCECVHVCSWPD